MRPTRSWFLPLIAAGMVAAGQLLPGHVEAPRPPHSVTVTQSSYACGLTKGTTVVSGRYARHGGARATAVELPTRTSNETLARTSGWNESTVDAQALLVSTADADGAGAVGFAGSRGAKSVGGGLSIQACPGVVQNAWYLGAGSGSRHFSTVTLTNLSATPAVATVKLWGLDGQVDAINADALVLKAFQTRRVRLDAVAAGEAELALQVSSRRGALAVSVQDTSTAVFGGTEFMPPTGAPARTQVISGVAGSTNTRQLLLLNPSQVTARVKVEILGQDGVFVPRGLDEVKVPAGKLTVLDMSKAAGKSAQAWRLTSDQPLVGAARMAASNQDFAYAVSGPMLSGPALAPVRLGKLIDGARLEMTAPKAAAVTVTAYDKDMKAQGSTLMQLSDGSTVSLDLAKDTLFAQSLDKLAYVVVASKGQVSGAMVYTSGTGLSTVPLRAAPLTALAPDVRPAR